MEDYTPKLTPIEKVGDIYLKRDDKFCIAGIRGGKVRACWHLATRGSAPCAGLITASARVSPQAQIVARLGERLGVPVRCHMPEGSTTEEMEDMLAHGAELVRHRPGHNSVIIARAITDHKERPSWRYIPFGMQHPDAVGCTRRQVKKIPKGVKRVIVPVGSGMTAAGVLHGLRDEGLGIPVLGVRVGANPIKRLDGFGPFGWRSDMQIIDVSQGIPYHEGVDARVGSVLLDPIYEAKCLEYVEPGDLLWIVGIRSTAATE